MARTKHPDADRVESPAPAPPQPQPQRPLIPSDVNVSEGDLLTLYGLTQARLEVSLRAHSQKDRRIAELTEKIEHLEGRLSEVPA